DSNTLPRAATPDTCRGTETVRQVDYAPQVEAAPQGGVRAESAYSGQPHASGMLGQRLKRSLGEVIKTLRQANLRALAPDALPGVKPRGAPKIPEGAQFLTRSFTAHAGS